MKMSIKKVNKAMPDISLITVKPDIHDTITGIT